LQTKRGDTSLIAVSTAKLASAFKKHNAFKERSKVEPFGQSRQQQKLLIDEELDQLHHLSSGLPAGKTPEAKIFTPGPLSGAPIVK